jgi:hypothetical protein
MAIRLPDYDPVLEYPQWKAKYFPDPEPPPPPPPPKPMWEDKEAMWARYKELVKANTARAQAIYDSQELAAPRVGMLGDADDGTGGDDQGAVTDIAPPADVSGAGSIALPTRLAANDLTSATTDAASLLFSPIPSGGAPLNTPEPAVVAPAANGASDPQPASKSPLAAPADTASVSSPPTMTAPSGPGEMPPEMMTPVLQDEPATF